MGQRYPLTATTVRSCPGCLATDPYVVSQQYSGRYPNMRKSRRSSLNAASVACGVAAASSRRDETKSASDCCIMISYEFFQPSVIQRDPGSSLTPGTGVSASSLVSQRSESLRCQASVVIDAQQDQTAACGV